MNRTETEAGISPVLSTDGLGQLPEDVLRIDAVFPGMALADQVRAYTAQEVHKRLSRPIAYMTISGSGTVRFTDNPEAARELESYGWSITPLAEGANAK